MLKQMLLTIGLMLSFSETAAAGDRFYFPSHAFAGPAVVYVPPVVAYQPAYVVPTPVVVAAPYPVYTTQYYAPLVPIATGPVYAPRAVAAPVYLGRRHYHRPPRGYRGVEIEFERDGDIEIDYK